MTLVIAVRCKTGAAIIADRRSRIVERGQVSFDDEYGKILRTPTALVYNHGYNRIDNRDWKMSGDRLGPDAALPVFESISREMTRKSNKHCGYVFVAPSQTREVAIDAGKRPTLHQVPNTHDRLLSGDGKAFVDLSPLSDLSERSIEDAATRLEKVFLEAHDRLLAADGDTFSRDYDLEIMTG